MGADSAGVSGFELQVRADRKVFQKGEFIFGFTSSFRMGQLLQYELKIPDCLPNEDIHKYMVVKVVKAVRSCLVKGGYAKKKDEAESGGCFLVGYRGCLFCIESDYQVGETVHKYAAVGCGAELALGALYATVSFKISARQRVRLALQAAQEFNASVREPFHIEVLE